MKKKILTVAAIAAGMMLAASSCKRASELPPVTDVYEETFILPDPEDLTAEERAYLNALEEEYDNAIK